MSDMAQLISVKLSRFDGSPWGFRLQGGKDFGTPLVVQKVNGGSPAEVAGLRAGDAVIKVNNTDTYNLKHKDAQDVIVKAGNSFELTVQRGGNTWRPSVSPVTPSIPSPQPHAPVNNIPPVTKTSLAANKQDVQHIGSGHNLAPKPFSNGSSDGAPIKSIVNKQYNSPVGIYSEQTIAETLSAQAEVLAGGVLGVNFKKNEKNYDAQNSEVFRMVQEADKEPKSPEPAEPIVNGGVVSSPLPTLTGLRSVSAPETKPQPTTPQNNGLPPGQNICADCERLIVGLFVRIKEKNLHVECFKCSTCGTSLKNVGYYNINNKLYCDIHAKLVARQQSTQGTIPTTVSTGGKAPVGTITAALGNLGIDSPKSPPPPPSQPQQQYQQQQKQQVQQQQHQQLNGTSITAPFALQNYNRRPNSDLGNLPRGYIRPTEYINDKNNEDNTKLNDEKTYTSTITIKTGNEVGNNDKNKNECIVYDNNKNQTNKFIVINQLNPTIKLSNDNSSSIICAPVISKENSQNKATVELHIKPECQVTNQTNNSPIIISSINNNLNNKIQSSYKKSIIHNNNNNNNGNDKIDFSRSQFNPQDYNIYLNNHKEKFSGVISALGNNKNIKNNNINKNINNNNNNNIKNDNFINYLNRVNNNNNYNSLRRSFNVKSKFKNNNNNGVEKKIDKIENINGHFFNSNIINNNKNNNNNKDSMIKVDAKNVKNYINSANFTSSASSLAAFLLANRSSHPETLYCSQNTPPRMPTPPNSTSSSSSVSSSSSSPPPPPQPPLLPSSTTTTTTSSSWTNHLGNQPNDTPTYRPLQTTTLGGGNKTIGSSGQTSTLNYSSTNNNKSSINSFIRPQSQTVTESYHEECDYYEEIKETKEIIKQKTEEQPRPPSSVRSKSLAWPPIKNLEDSNYPTASPIWVDPNPVLSRLSKQNVPEKRAYIQENRSQNVSRLSNKEEIMDNSCNKPFYRKECIETRRECRSSSLTRPDSAEGMRRSLTPTRINQPTPKPWIATVTSECNTFSHVEAPVPPEPPVCRKVCTCEIICERVTGPGGPEHEQEHTYRKVVCELCTPEPPPVEEYEEPQEPEPEETQETYEEENYEIVDMAKLVPPDVAVCPRGVENQHNMYTETTEKDEGNMHIKKTTIYEKTVELLSPSRAGTPIEGEEDNGRASAASADREVENIAGRYQYSECADVVSSAIETSRMMEEAKKEEEQQRRAIQEERRIEEERIRQEKEESRIREENRLKIIQQEKEEKQRRVQQQKKETERICRQEEEERCGKHVSFASRSQGVVQQSVQPSEVYESREYVRQGNTCSTKTEECCRNLREQVEVHKNLREQQQPERRTLQERRLEKRFRPQSAEEIQAAEAAARAKESLQRKHVQFVTQTESGNVRPLPQSSIKNSTPKEWRSEMVNALTTVSDRPYSPFETTTTCCSIEENNECQSKTTITRKTRYEETCRPCPVQKPQPVKPPPYEERPISPFTEALTTAPERPYTPLGDEHEQDTVVCVKRSRTPTDKTIQGYCHPAEILYTDAKTRQSRSREKKLRKVEGPRPLPTPPPDYKLRDASVSPTRSLSRPETPSRQGVMAGLKKPGTIPSYQKYLVAEECEAVHEHSYTPSRTPTPTPHRPKSPAPGPPQAPACYIKAHAPMIRADPPPPRQPTNSFCSQPGQTEKISYHLEEDTPQGHLSRDYHGTRTSYCENSQQNTQSYSCQQQQQQQHQYEESSVGSQSKQQLGDWDGSGCGIEKVSSYQPSMSCPLKNAPPSRPVTPCQSVSQTISQSTCQSQCKYESSNSQSAISERVQKTGVRVLPPCPKVQTQVCQKRQTYQSEEERTMSSYNVQKSNHQESNCASTGVTVMPCRTTTSSGVSKTGVVIIPCEGEDNDTCPRSGICITPTPDRSGLCVSPAQHGKSSSSCSGPNKGPGSGGNQVDVGNCPASGIRVGSCPDGSICVAPCRVPGVTPVQAPKTILKAQCPSSKTIPFPHIPLPGKTTAPEPNPCDSCPLNNQCEQTSQQTNKQLRTNLSNQLTRMTIKRDKHVVQLFKPQSQSSSQQQQCDDSERCEIQQPYRSQQNQTRPSFTPDTRKVQNLPAPTNLSSQPDLGCGLGGASPKSRRIAGNSAPTRGRGILNQAGTCGRQPLCAGCNAHVRGPFITALGQIWCPEHFVCVNSQCNRPLQDIGFVQEKGQLYCEYCFERFLAPACNKCNNKIKGDSLTAIGKHFHPECFSCTYCGKLFGNSPFFLEDGLPYCEADWNELFTTKCYACGFPVEAGDRWVEALNNNYHSQCFNCSTCKANLEGQSFYAKGGRPFCKNHAR